MVALDNLIVFVVMSIVIIADVFGCVIKFETIFVSKN